MLDADGLTLFQKNPNELFDLLNKRRKRENIILTPHEGEFNRLFDFGKMSKIDKANRAANITKSTILFKGNDTIISSPKKIGRNDPCPCGSGKKYKQCHGNVA